jgi:hypothetical protein
MLTARIRRFIGAGQGDWAWFNAAISFWEAGAAHPRKPHRSSALTRYLEGLVDRLSRS